MERVAQREKKSKVMLFKYPLFVKKWAKWSFTPDLHKGSVVVPWRFYFTFKVLVRNMYKNQYM